MATFKISAKGLGSGVWINAVQRSFGMTRAIVLRNTIDGRQRYFGEVQYGEFESYP